MKRRGERVRVREEEKFREREKDWGKKRKNVHKERKNR